MIPSYIHKDVKSTAEKRIFELIQNDSRLSDVRCFHSLGIARHYQKKRGEVDFVLLDKWGIICLEIKGGRVNRQKGIWTFTDRYGRENKKREGPFEQVSSSMFSLIEDLKKKIGDSAYKIRIGYGLVFPDVHFKEESPEWENQVIYDLADIVYPFSKYVNRIKEYWSKKLGNNKHDLSEDYINSLMLYIRGDFEIVEPLWKKVEDTEEDIIKLTKNQYKALDRMVSNQRIFFKGPAGTGKTLLAFEQAKRLALMHKKVLLLCFNVLLGKKLENETQKNGMEELIRTCSIHKYYNDIIEQGKYFKDFLSEKSTIDSKLLFSKLYPKYFVQSIKDLNIEKFDSLIIDEGQDILCEDIFQPLDFVLKGGLKQGQWYVFYDSNNQGELYHNYNDDYVKKLKEFGATEYCLDINCRNTRPIALQTAVVSGFKMAETLVDQGEKVIYFWYKDLKEQSEQIVHFLKKIFKEGIKPGDVTILYPGGNTEVRESILELGIGCSIEELTAENVAHSDSKTVLYICSVQAYKGIENKIIILIGIDKVEGSWINTVNYVGMSRARELLCVSINASLKENYNKKIIGYLELSETYRNK